MHITSLAKILPERIATCRGPARDMMWVKAEDKEGRYSSISIVPARSMPILISKKTCGFGMLAADPPAETSSSVSSFSVPRS